MQECSSFRRKNKLLVSSVGWLCFLQMLISPKDLQVVRILLGQGYEVAYIKSLPFCMVLMSV